VYKKSVSELNLSSKLQARRIELSAENTSGIAQGRYCKYGVFLHAVAYGFASPDFYNT
jgi:hypothetical protein